jgi:hypothetical protein
MIVTFDFNIKISETIESPELTNPLPIPEQPEPPPHRTVEFKMTIESTVEKPVEQEPLPMPEGDADDELKPLILQFKK